MRRTLLIVDDNRVNREILKKMLSVDYEILEAANGVEALEAMRRSYRTLSAVLLDLSMPVMNGFDVMERMREDADLTHLPVIVTTGRTEEESEVKALSLGANDYITKPYNATIIRQRIQNTINLRETAATVNALQRDALTGLYTREIYLEKVGEMIHASPPGSYVITSFDIENFKVINDQYGMEMGDRVLRHVGECLARQLPLVGGVASRISADHFSLCYAVDLTDDEAIPSYQRDITQPPFLDRPIRIRAGRYVINDLSIPVSTMYDRATIAETSIRGRYDVNVAQYDESMRMRILQEQRIVNEMKGALTGGQFEVWYQPQCNHATGALIGAEALVRWRHPQDGLVAPGVFVPIFERNGFIYEMDKFVWEQVCRHLRGWIDEGREPLPVSVNISRYDLFCDDLLPFLTGLVARHRIPVEMLRLEITESAFAEDSEHAIDAVESLARSGFTIEIDDFGSGYSSLNILKDVPADVLKLDMRFLQSGRNTERGGNILESVVRMAKWLGMPVIAEGVETIEQANFLKSIGCNYIQGYLYARPMPKEAYERFVTGYDKEHEMKRLELLVNIDRNAFWNPESIETLIFNSYVGAACVFEYRDGQTELLRVNDNYIREVGSKTLSAAEVSTLDLALYMDDENRAILYANIEESIRTGEESACEVCLTGLDEPGTRVYIRSAVRLIARAGERYLFYAAILNMTALREAERSERDASERMRSVMDDTPGGFCQMQIMHDRSARIMYVNNSFCELVGMSQDDIMARYGDDALRAVHPDDVGAIRELYRNGAQTGEVFHARCRLFNADGEYIQTVIYGRIIHTGSGEMFVNAFYTNATAPPFDDRCRDLLDNLPCGAALYRYAQGRLYANYFNRRYCELVGRDVPEPAKADPVGALHPDDRAPLMAEIEAAIAQQRDLSRMVRIRYADSADEYRGFRTRGKIVDDGDGGHVIYVLMIPTSAEMELYTQMLPLLLATIMDSTSDLAFAKDKQLRYLCGSRPFVEMVGLASPDELVGKTDYDIFDKPTAERYRSDDKSLIMSEKPIVDMLEPIPSDDGVQHYSSTSKYLLRDSYGNIIGLYGVGRDVTEYRRAFDQLKLLTESMPCGIASFEIAPGSMRIIYFNEGFYSYSGYTREEYERIVAADTMGLILPEDRAPLLEGLDALRCGERRAEEYTCRCRKKDGGYRWMSLRIAASDSYDERIVINVVQFDITERKLREEMLRMSEEQYRIAMKQSGNIMCRFDVADRSVNMSPEIAKHFNMPEKVLDVPYGPVRLGNIAPGSADAYIDFYESILRGERTKTAEFEGRTIFGFRWFKSIQTTIFSDDGAPVYAVISLEDITFRRRQEEEHEALLQNERILRRLVDIDGMTGAYNKTVAEEKIRQRMEEGVPGALLVIDIDDLKAINDSLGHPQGDRAIRAIADILETQFRRSDIIGRIGGDEFIVFLETIDDADRLVTLLTTLIERIGGVNIGEEDQRPLRASIGVAQFSGDETTFEELYARADKALYNAKRNGKQQFAIYTPQMD